MTDEPKKKKRKVFTYVFTEIDHHCDRVSTFIENSGDGARKRLLEYIRQDIHLEDLKETDEYQEGCDKCGECVKCGGDPGESDDDCEHEEEDHEKHMPKIVTYNGIQFDRDALCAKMPLETMSTRELIKLVSSWKGAYDGDENWTELRIMIIQN